MRLGWLELHWRTTGGKQVKVQEALGTYAMLAKSLSLLDFDTRDIIMRLEAMRGGLAKDAARALGPWSGWPVARRRAFVRLLMQARNTA